MFVIQEVSFVTFGLSTIGAVILYHVFLRKCEDVRDSSQTK